MKRVLYISPQLPRLSETFVYREILGLRDRGWPVACASLRAPERNLGDPRADALADEVLVVYERGGAWLARALAELATHAPSALRTLLLALADSFTARDVQGAARLKIPVQAFAALALARRLRAQQTEWIHAHFAHASATVAMYAASHLGIPFSMTGHAVDIFRDRALLAEKLRRASFVACISNWHRTFYQSISARPERDYPVIRCGVDTQSFAPRSETADPPPAVLLAVGRLVAKKGFDLLVDAMPAISRRHPDLKLWIAGDGPEKAALEKKVAASPARESIQLLGRRSSPQVRELMSQASLFALPCKTAGDGDRDGIPVVLMEAMACGLPVICGDLPAIRELVEDGQTGLMVPPNNTDALAQAVLNLLENNVLRRTLAEAGRNRVVGEFSTGRNIDRLVAAFSGMESA